MKKFILLFITLAITVSLIAILSTPNETFAAVVDKREELVTQNYDPLLPSPETSSYISYTDFRKILDLEIEASTTANVVKFIDEYITDEDKIIRIDTAQELYRFSVDVSYLDSIKYENETTKLDFLIQEKMMMLDYALGNNIDYSVMRSKQFIPLGYKFETVNAESFELTFKGTFNGMGFTISNLYLSGYETIHIKEVDEELGIETVITSYYSMFTINDGIITNFGLINPTLELRTEHDDLTKASNIVGKNNHIVEKVYVIDNRNQQDAGIRMRPSVGATTSRYQASGVVFENSLGATFKDSYYVSKMVVNQAYINSYNVQPVLYINNAPDLNEVKFIQNLVYDRNVYLQTLTVGSSNILVNPVSSLHTAETTNDLMNGSSLGNSFYYYPEDGYPQLIGLKYVDGFFKINNAFEFIHFNMMMNYESNYLNKAYRMHQFMLMEDINLNDLSKNAYQTPSLEFEGVLTSTYKEEADGKSRYRYIFNLEIKQGVSLNGNNHLGLFSILKGKVENLNFVNYQLSYENSIDFLYAESYIGSIAAILDNGEINNVSVNLNINLKSDEIGTFMLGGITGLASGKLSKTYVEGVIDAGNHISLSTLNKDYYMGGIVGKTSNEKLVIYDALNKATLHGFGISSTHSTSPVINNYMGGVIGYVENFSNEVNDFGLIVNQGTLKPRSVTTGQTTTHYIGGVIGESKGEGYELNLLSGLWVNKGTFDLLNRDQNKIYVSGVVNSNHDLDTEFIYLENRVEAKLIINNYTNLYFASVLFHRGLGGITLSQSYNAMHVEFTNLLSHKDYSGVFHSVNPTHNNLRYVENKGNIIFKGITTTENVIITGITSAINTNFLNVTQSGEIVVYNINFRPSSTPAVLTGNNANETTNNNNNTSTSNLNENNFWISGITRVLSPEKVMKNTLNDGAIFFTFNEATQNIYVGGLINQNGSGDLELKDNDAMPKASMGIINSINNADIKSSLPEKYNYLSSGIFGVANTYVGGITTFNGSSSNGGSIQDSANMGDIEVINKSSTTDQLAGYIRFGNTDVGGAVTNFRYGVIIGGISASVNHGKSRIYDSVNSGNIIAVSKYFARSGGVLAIALDRELRFGNVSTSYFKYSNNAGQIAEADRIINSKLSNGLNYGNVSALTEIIGTYATSTNTSNTTVQITGANNIYGAFYNAANGTVVREISYRSSTQDRPGVYSASGGVIGYGLSEMSKMLNHGQISSTDVAGGVVGATVVITHMKVKIDTAINYGRVRAVRETIYNKFINNPISYEEIRGLFYNEDDAFIFPTNPSDRSKMSITPNTKRGIGGVFGRLQRAYMQEMTSEGGIFDYVVNLDPNVDLIGRLDQVGNFTQSNEYFLFSGSKYYSAKKHETTQDIFTGFRYKEVVIAPNTANNNNVIVEATAKTISEKARYEYKEINGDLYKRRLLYVEEVKEHVMSGGLTYVNNGSVTPYQVQSNTTDMISREVISSYWREDGDFVETEDKFNITSTNKYSDIFNIQPITLSTNPKTTTTFTTNQIVIQNNNNNSTTYNVRYYFGSVPIPFIHEGSDITDANNIYAENHEMRNDRTQVGGKPITSYIYYVRNEILSDRFISNRPNGMYVLATTAGSQFGSTLPANIKIGNLYRLDGYLPYNIDYENINNLNKEELRKEVIDEYLSLYQTSMNDKSKLLKNDQYIKFENDSKTVNIYGNEASVDNNTNTINLRLNTTANNVNGEVIMELIHAVLPKDALIAKTVLDSGYADWDEYRRSLEPEIGKNISTSFKPEFKLDTSPGTQLLGTFTSYSQASLLVKDLFLLEYYATTYEVYVTLYTGTANFPSIYQVYQDAQLVTGSDNNGTYTPSTNLNHTLRAIYNYQAHIDGSYITDGYDVKDTFRLEYLDGSNYITIPTNYYSLTSIPYRSLNLEKTSNQFEFTVSLDAKLRGGTYRIYFDYGNQARYIVLTKNMQTGNSILEIGHDTQSIMKIATTSDTINTNVDFDYVINFVNGAKSTIDPTIPIYLDNYKHDIPFLNHIKLSNFASISKIVISDVQYNNSNYRFVVINYTVISESGQEKEYTHTITERPISITQVYKDNIVTNAEGLTALREIPETVIGLSFNFNRNLLGSLMHLESTNQDKHFDIEVTALDVTGNTMSRENVKGLSYSVTNRLNIHMSDETLPGTYTFTILYVRDNSNITLTRTITLTKLQGTSSYLNDIRFAENANDTDYATIYVRDNLGLPNTTKYVPKVYFAGIDYNEADTDGINQFIVYGTVVNIPLDSYSPIMLEYLPKGATIAKYIGETPAANYEQNDPYSIEVSIDSSEEDKKALLADFNREDILEDIEIVVRYRVTSEDGLSVTYYYITVTDAEFNFTMLFEVYYGEIGVNNSLNLSPLKNKSIAITVTNFIAQDAQGNKIEFDQEYGFDQMYTKSGGIISDVTMLYHEANYANYRYRFGRNRSGFYNIHVTLPNQNLIYEIVETEHTLEDTKGFNGKYYYIMNASRNRTKTFKVYIFENEDARNLWGLYDYHNFEIE